MTKREAKQVIKKAYEQDLVEWSGDAIADGSDPYSGCGFLRYYWVSVDNLVEPKSSIHPLG